MTGIQINILLQIKMPIFPETTLSFGSKLSWSIHFSGRQIKLLKFLPLLTYPVDGGTLLTDAIKFVRKRQDNL